MARKKQLVGVIERFLNKFSENSKFKGGWPSFTVCVNTKKTWITGQVDDETFDIIKHAKKLIKR